MPRKRRSTRRRSTRRQASRSRLPLDVFLRRRRRRRWVTVVLALVLAVLVVLADRRGLLLEGGDDLARYDDRVFVVSRVVDGDTLAVAAPDAGQPTTRVRLWGINTPELNPPDGPGPEPGAVAATERAAALAVGQPVRLHLEPHRLRDRYDRVLAYVELPDGRVLNELLLLEGLAEADDRWPHRHMERYELLELQARREARGLWAED